MVALDSTNRPSWLPESASDRTDLENLGNIINVLRTAMAAWEGFHLSVGRAYGAFEGLQPHRRQDLMNKVLASYEHEKSAQGSLDPNMASAAYQVALNMRDHMQPPVPSHNAGTNNDSANPAPQTNPRQGPGTTSPRGHRRTPDVPNATPRTTGTGTSSCAPRPSSSAPGAAASRKTPACCVQGSQPGTSAPRKNA